MMSVTAAAREMTRGQRIAWYCLHLIAVLVPVAMSNISFLNLPALSFTFDQFALVKVVLLRSLVLVAVVAWAGDLLTRGGGVRWVRTGWLAVGFVGAAALSTALAIDPLPSVFGIFARHEGLVTLVCYFAVFFVVLQLVTSGARVRSFARTIVLTAGVVSVYGLIQAAGLDPLEWPGLRFDPRMAFSTFGNPDLLGGYLVAPLVIALSLLFSETERRWQWVYGLCTAAVSGALLATFVRGAWLGALVGVALFGIVVVRTKTRVSPRRWALLVGAILVVVLVAGLSLAAPGIERNVAGRVLSTFRFDQGSIATRFMIWRVAVKAIGERPLLGAGPDGFGLAYTPVEPAEIVQETRSMQIADNAHDVPLHLAATVGLLGAAFFYAFVFSSMWVSRAVVFPREAGGNRLLLSGIGIGAIATLVYQLSGLSDVGSTWMLWASLAIVLAPAAASREVAPAGAWARAVVGGLALLAVAWAVWNASTIVADFRYLKGVENPDAAAGAADLEAAVRLNPLPSHYWGALGSSYGRLVEQTLATGAGAVQVQEARVAFEKAERAFARAQAISPHDYESYVDLAEVYNRSSYYLDPALAQKGEQAAREAVRLRPNGAEPNYQLALSLMLLGNLDGALETAEKSAWLIATYPDARLLIGQIRQQQGDLVGAKAAYEEGLDLLKAGDVRASAVRQVLASIEASLSAGSP